METKKSFYAVYADTLRIRKQMGFVGYHNSYKVMKYLAEFWARNPWAQ